MCFSVNYQADEQLELLNLLSPEDPSNQLKRENEREGNFQLSSIVEQKFQNSKSHASSSGIEVRPDLNGRARVLVARR